MSHPLPTPTRPLAATAREHTQDLLAYIDASPSPWHATANAAQRLADAEKEGHEAQAGGGKAVTEQVAARGRHNGGDTEATQPVEQGGDEQHGRRG